MAFSFLEPLFSSVGMPLATVSLHILAVGAACVGMCLGILLPFVMPGACLGGIVAILLGFLFPSLASLYMIYVAPLLVLLGALCSTK